MKIKLLVSDSFFPLLEDRSRYLVMCGGRGSGKSEFAARKLLYRALREGRHRFLVMRKVRKTLQDSAIRVVLSLLEENAIPYEYNKSERLLQFLGPAGLSQILFDGLDDPEKIKSIKGITSIWLEETTEFSRDDFLKVDLTLREPGPAYKQMMMTFNPQEVEAPWLKEMFFGAEPYPATTVHRSTVEDNPIAEVRAEYVRILEGLRLQDEALYKIARLGEWAARTGQIYSWDVQPLPAIAFDDTWYSGDYGYSVDPAAVVQIFRRADEFWVRELVYEHGLTNAALSDRMDGAGVSRNKTVYFDAAEPKSNEELRRMGWHIQPAAKGPDSVRAGIDFLRSKKIHIVQGSTNLLKEHNGYCWRKDRLDRPLPEPVKFDDHLMDATRYGIFTHCAKSRARIWSAQWGA